MNKFLPLSLLAVAALTVNAQETVTFNFFDPADCDEEGWLWLDTPEKIAKYVGVDKKIQLINSSLEIEDPEYPGEYLQQETVADPDVKGYNSEGVKGGEGSKTGGIILPQADDHGVFGNPGGGILVQMPDCAIFDVYMSQELSGIYTWIKAGKGILPADGLTYIWNDDDVSWDPNVPVGPLPTPYEAYDLNVQDIKLDLNYGSGTPDYLQIYGPKGEARTAGFYNFSLCSMIVQGLRIRTFTNVSGVDDDAAAVEGIVADADITINGKTVLLSAPAEISVYNAAGVKVAGAYGTSLDCSALNGLFIVKAGKKALKAVF